MRRIDVAARDADDLAADAAPPSWAYVAAPLPEHQSWRAGTTASPAVEEPALASASASAVMPAAEPDQDFFAEGEALSLHAPNPVRVATARIVVAAALTGAVLILALAGVVSAVRLVLGG